MQTDRRTTRLTRPRKRPRAAEHRSAQLPALREIFARRDLLSRRGEYELLGRLEILHTAAGTLDFRRCGPVLAALASGELISLAPWLELPPLPKLRDELCPACAAPCDECKGRGKRACVGVGCGGRGTIPAAKRIACACARNGRPRPTCKQCRGTGERETRKRCPLCRGTKLSKCTLCNATGRMSTGRLHGAVDSRGHADSRAAICPECDGNARVIERKAQQIELHVRGELESYVVVGPLVRMVMSRLPGRAPGMDIYDVLPDGDGNYMMLLLTGTHSGSAMYFHGGTLRRPQH